MQSRRLLIVGGSVIGVVLLLLFITTLFNKKKTADSVAVCDRFMQYLIVNNTTGSYAMLSSSAKLSDDQSSWTGKLYSLSYVYAGATATKNGDPQTTSTNSIGGDQNSNDQKDSVPRTEYKYVVKNSASTSDASCILTTENGKPVVDGFISSLRTEGQDQ